MSNDSVTFHVRCEKLQHVMKINTPENIFDFIEIMKLKLNVEENDDIVILCPTTEGKMMELKTNADIEFLKKNKLCYNAISKEIYCNVELVIIVIKNEQQIQDDPIVQMKVLTNKVDQLSIQINKLSDSLSENSSNIMKILGSIVSENYHINKDFQDISSASIKPLDKGNDLSNIPSNNEETNTGSRKKKPAKKDKNKNPSNMPNSPAITSQISITKEIQSNGLKISLGSLKK
ncbi:uncharacterized protein LOC126906313 isoform X2 [Daktulosphaira vitifoliae]|uniref:uncharacterized protein LOC126906313 isoform X2 n=1 Tax=Daktulosphaira vitifoliae TaxID=58002 RepID=UPI0021A97AF4|nr:uncharacterized protein LOC126906313 isoform X2 [Daktulosphaira vitifoliae]